MWCTAALNVMSVALCWWLARRYWGPEAAFFAALFLAANPWAAHFSRGIWEPNLLVPFALAWAISGSLALVEKRRGALVVHIVLLSALVQLHYSGLALVPVTAWLLARARRAISRRELLLGVALAVVLASPFLYYLLSQGRQGLSSLEGMTTRNTLDAQSFHLWWMAVTGDQIHALTGAQAYRDFLHSVPNPVVPSWAPGLLVVCGVILWLRAASRGYAYSADKAGLLVSLWGLAPLVFFTWHLSSPYLHYYVLEIPAASLAAGYALSRTASGRGRIWRWGAVLLGVGIAVLQTTTYGSLLRFVAGRATPGGFGMPVKYVLQATEQAQAQGLAIVVVSPSDDPRIGDWPAVFDVLLRGTPHRLVDGTRAALFPGTPATLIVAPGAQQALQVYARAGVMDRAQTITTRQGEQPFLIVRMTEGLYPPLEAAQEPRQLANGTQVLGYAISGELRAGMTVDWWIAWRVVQPPESREEYHLFNHLLDGQGIKVAQADGPTVRSGDWSAGDVVVQPFRLQLPESSSPGPFWMRVGMYTYPGLQGVPVVDASGQPVADSVLLGPLPTGQ
jgi:hypothetical protein